ncbi:MAG TPA: hypothetical protein VFB43_12195 [Terracidiphilus sp.]|nr:hypothetical protein [Terracidiphilus sp.]
MRIMFGSDILDIVIGMVFVFLLLSLICSGLNEFLEALVKNRARDLERGIRELIGDPENATNFVDKIYNHGLVNSLFKGCYSSDKKRNLPSYIPATNFALAVIDLVKNPPATGLKLPDNVKKAYSIFETQAAGDEAKLQANLEDWFNTGMDRVSGWYRRRAQWILIALGLIVAIAINADALQIARVLSNDASLRKGLVAMAQARASQPLTPAVQTAAPPANNTVASNGTSAGDPPATAPVSAMPATLQTGQAGQTAPTLATSADQVQQTVAAIESIGLPVGWKPAKLEPGENAWKHAVFAAPGAIKEHGIGWLLTAIAASMGAPFWFDLVGKIVSVRSTMKPQADNS